MSNLRKPTRRDLLVVIGRLQNLIGTAMAQNDDRNPNRFSEVEATMRRAHDLCIDARSHDPPLAEKGPWA